MKKKILLLAFFACVLISVSATAQTTYRLVINNELNISCQFEVYARLKMSSSTPAIDANTYDLTGVSEPTVSAWSSVSGQLSCYSLEGIVVRLKPAIFSNWYGNFTGVSMGSFGSHTIDTGIWTQGSSQLSFTCRMSYSNNTVNVTIGH